MAAQQHPGATWLLRLARRFPYDWQHQLTRYPHSFRIRRTLRMTVLGQDISSSTPGRPKPASSSRPWVRLPETVRSLRGTTSPQHQSLHGEARGVDLIGNFTTMIRRLKGQDFSLTSGLYCRTASPSFLKGSAFEVILADETLLHFRSTFAAIPLGASVAHI